jgi:hypothetical protein
LESSNFSAVSAYKHKRKAFEFGRIVAGSPRSVFNSGKIPAGASQDWQYFARKLWIKPVVGWRISCAIGYFEMIGIWLESVPRAEELQ